MTAVAHAEGLGASAKPLAITGVLVLVVMSMVIPIPAALLDAGIALSIATSVLIRSWPASSTSPPTSRPFR